MNILKSTVTRLASFWSIICLLVAFSVGTEQAYAQTYKIRAGDTLRIEVLEDASLNRTVLVAPDGRISLPQAGTLSVRGKSVEAVQSDLIGRLSGNFANTPNVFVSIAQLVERRIVPPSAPAPDPVISIFVVGEVGKPGELDVDPGTNMLQLFAVMGGFTKFAATKRIQLRRGTEVYQFSYDQIEAGGQGGQTVLRDGDVVVVPQRRLFE
ncbi:polysaccharide biosynthesis/export family protein [Sulfitobacter sp.]|uniref:polysaccharide biosynthesis/export family protein n=1 Tax=Sulfitobacter sp. TaxID=1903071 RepID=UPI003EF85DFB